MKNKPSSLQEYSVKIFRIMLSLIFIVAGANHLFASSAVSNRLVNTDVGAWLTAYLPADLMVVLAGAGLLTGGISLLSGFKTRWAALGLLTIIIPITLVVQTQGVQTIGPFFKNIGLMGGLIFFLANGNNDIVRYNNITSQKTTS